MDLVDSLLDADKYTKIYICNMFGNLQVAELNEVKMACKFHAGQFFPLSMPFASTGDPRYIQYFIHAILLGRIEKDTEIDPDYIMVYKQ